jgi:hypothetical protein
MRVGYDSPEAFADVLWRTFWPEKYGKTRISLWDAADEKEEARAFFVEHMRKIIALRKPDRHQESQGRRGSKTCGYPASHVARWNRLHLVGQGGGSLEETPFKNSDSAQAMSLSGRRRRRDRPGLCDASSRQARFTH